MEESGSVSAEPRAVYAYGDQASMTAGHPGRRMLQFTGFPAGGGTLRASVRSV